MTTHACAEPAAICKILPNSGEGDGVMLGLALIVGVTEGETEIVGDMDFDSELDDDIDEETLGETEMVGVIDGETDGNGTMMSEAGGVNRFDECPVPN
jgi:hypothetical protein